MTHRLDPSILREYDIRGVFGDTLGEADARAIGRAFAARIQRVSTDKAAVCRDGSIKVAVCRDGSIKVAVCRDGRLSSPVLEAALVEGLVAGGCDVVRLGLGPTPMLYYAQASAQDVQGGIQVTGSHNPGDHNGFKMVLEGRPFFGADIQALGEQVASGVDAMAQPGPRRRGIVERRDILDAYVERLLQALRGIDPARIAGLRIGWDCGNGAAGPAVAALTARLPGEHHLLYAQVDGRFPHHHPDPSIAGNLADLQRLVAGKRLDFGVAFDGDGDRIAVIDGHGRIVAGDQLLMIHAQDVLAAHPGATVIADVKASQAVFDRIAALGGRPLMWKTGHSLIKSRMKETGALLAGETTGHLFFADDYYGFDDALYAALRLIAASIRLDRTVAQLHDALPVAIITPELRFPVAEARKFAVIGEVAARLAAAGARVNAIDGVRVATADGWWLLRASNTQAVLVARAEGHDQAGLARLLALLDAQLAASGVSR